MSIDDNPLPIKKILNSIKQRRFLLIQLKPSLKIRMRYEIVLDALLLGLL